MGNLFNALNGLKTNIFGGGNTGKTTPKLDHDPFQFSSIQYPRDLTSNGGIGHYMLFYVNVQDKTKYVYEGADGETVGGVIEVPGKPYTLPNHPRFGAQAGQTITPPSKFVKGGSKLTGNYFTSSKGGSQLTSDVKVTHLLKK